MKYNRLISFQKDPAKLSQYRLALGMLYQLGVDHILADLGSAKNVAEDHVNVLLINALQNQKAVGFKECIDRLFSLDTTEIPSEERSQPDYGAIDKLVEQGLIKKEDVDSFVNGL